MPNTVGITSTKWHILLAVLSHVLNLPARDRQTMSAFRLQPRVYETPVGSVQKASLKTRSQERKEWPGATPVVACSY